MARNIFEDTEQLDTVVRRIMTQAEEVLPCERCTVYILDREAMASKRNRSTMCMFGTEPTSNDNDQVDVSFYEFTNYIYLTSFTPIMCEK